MNGDRNRQRPSRQAVTIASVQSLHRAGGSRQSRPTWFRLLIVADECPPLGRADTWRAVVDRFPAARVHPWA